MATPIFAQLTGAAAINRAAQYKHSSKNDETRGRFPVLGQGGAVFALGLVVPFFFSSLRAARRERNF